MKYLVSFLLLMASGQLLAQVVGGWSDQALLWRGFEFRWCRTNHRINNFESHGYIKDGNVYSVSNARAGSDQSDANLMENHFTLLNADQSIFYVNSIEVKVSGKSGYSVDKTVQLPLPDDAVDGKYIYHFLLNGFSIVSNGEASKLVNLEMSIGDEGDLKVGALFKCEKYWLDKFFHLCYECNKDEYDYTFNVYYLVVRTPSGSENGMHSFSNEFKIRKNSSNQGLAQIKDDKGDFNKACFFSMYDYDKYTVKSNKQGYGIKGFKISSENEVDNHLLMWSMFVSKYEKLGFMYHYNIRDFNRNNCKEWIRNGKSVIISYPQKSTNSLNVGMYYSAWKRKMWIGHRLASYQKKTVVKQKIDIEDFDMPFVEGKDIIMRHGNPSVLSIPVSNVNATLVEPVINNEGTVYFEGTPKCFDCDPSHKTAKRCFGKQGKICRCKK